MTHPQTVKQYRKFFADLGISHLEIKEKYGDLRKRETWEKAYDDYTYPNLPVIKAINEAIQQKAIPVISDVNETPVMEVVEVVEVSEVIESSSTSEENPELVPTPRPFSVMDRVDGATLGNFCHVGVAGNPKLVPATQKPHSEGVKTPSNKILTLQKLGKSTLGYWVNLPTETSFQQRSKCCGARSPPNLRLLLM